MNLLLFLCFGYVLIFLFIRLDIIPVLTNAGDSATRLIIYCTI